MQKPLIAILYLFFCLNLQATQIFEQHGWGLVINNFFQNHTFEDPPVMDVVDRKPMIPYYGAAIQGTWELSACNIVVLSLECR